MILLIIDLKYSGPTSHVAEMQHWSSEIGNSLQDCVRFWLQHSIDVENGGYFNNLDRSGAIYDTKKHVWLQGRQVSSLQRSPH